jgi:RND family efflux transporter MFP subunit
MTIRSSLALLGVVAQLVAAAAAAQEGMPAFPPAKVEIAIAELREMAPVVEIPGTVVSKNDSRVAAEVTGVLVWLAEVGDAVAKGDTIARIDPRLLQVEVKRARANVAKLQADYDYRERQLARTEELATSNNASETLVDESRALRDQAVHQLADARAQLERAEVDLNRTEIRAAFAGHVTERLASVGEFIDVGEDVVRLVDTQRIEISLPAPITLTPYVEVGQLIRVRNDGIERHHPIRTVVPVGDAVSRMVEIRLSADGGDWLVGSPVQVSLPSADSLTIVAIPRDALVERGGRSLIYQVMGDNTAKQISANIRMIDGLWVGIAEGIEVGDKVIIRGAERLTDGQALDVISRSE